MATESFDPKKLAEYQALMQNISAILTEIIEKDRNLRLSAAEKAALAAEELAKVEATMKAKFQELEAAGKILDNEERRNALLTQHRAGLEQYLARLTTEHYESQRALKDAEEALQDITDGITAATLAGAAGSVRHRELLRQQVTAQQKVARLSREQLDMEEAERQATIRKITAEMQYTDAKLKSSQAAQSAMTMLFGLDNKWRQTLAGSLVEMYGAARKTQGIMTSLITTVSHLSTTLSNVGSFGNVMGTSFEKIRESTIHMVTQIDRADVGLRSATGASREFSAGMEIAFDDKEVRDMAGSWEELAEVNSRLWSVASSFTSLLEPQQRELAKTAMAAKRFGISIDETATVAEKSFRVFGMQGPEMMNRLYNSAIAIGETPKNMVNNFTQAIDVMAQYSLPRAIEVLHGLSAIAKTTGIAVSTLTSIAMQFDTFEDAASNVAKLNAILGGAYFNSVQMLNATENERLYLLRAGLDATGRSWTSLDRWEKKVIAATAGIKNMNIASAFFQGNMMKVEDLTRKQEQQAEIQGQLIEAAGGVVNVFERLKRVFEEVGYLGVDLVEIVRDVVTVLKDLGGRGVLVTGMIFGIVNSAASAASQMYILRSATAATAFSMHGLQASLIGIAPLMLAAGAAWYYFSNKLREERSPAAWQLPGIAAQGLGALAENARRAARPLNEVGNRINSLNDKKVVSLTRALGMASQISAPNLNFGQVTAGVTELTRAVNNLDERKIDAFSTAMARLGATMRAIPKENVVAVTQLTKESRMVSALPAAAAARSGARISAQGSAVRAARESEAPPGGGRGKGMEGVLVTDSISVNVGGTILTRRIQETVRNEFAKYERRA